MKKAAKAILFALWLALAYFASSVQADFPPLAVRETDGSPNVKGVREIRISNGSLTNIGGGVISISTGGGGGGSLTVQEQDGSPSVADVDTLTFDQADGLVVSNPGGTEARIDLSGVPYARLTLTGAILNADLAGSIAASKLVGSDIATVGTITSGTWSGTTIALNKGGTGQTTKAAAFDALSPMSAAGDIIYGGASGTGTRLAKGTDGQVLTLASGLPSWADASGGSGLTIGTTTITSGTNGRLLFNNGGVVGEDGDLSFSTDTLTATKVVAPTSVTSPLVKSAAGAAIAINATAPTATTGASQAGVSASLTASTAVASTDTDGAAAGGAVTITAGDAARRNSGNAAGGDILLKVGAKIGSGRVGLVQFGGTTSSFAAFGYFAAPRFDLFLADGSDWGGWGARSFSAIDSNGATGIQINGTTTDAGQMRINQSGVIAWNGGTDATGGPLTTGLAQNAARVLEVNNGTPGTFGDLIARNLFVNSTTVKITSGTGSPESAVAAPVGSLYLRTDGGTGTVLYVKESGSGNTGWVAK